jgi:hypothetical protein
MGLQVIIKRGELSKTARGKKVRIVGYGDRLPQVSSSPTGSIDVLMLFHSGLLLFR